MLQMIAEVELFLDFLWAERLGHIRIGFEEFEQQLNQAGRSVPVLSLG